MNPKELEKEVLENTLGLKDEPDVIQLRNYLMTQSEPYQAYLFVKKSIKISDKLERALKIEMKRLGFGEFA